MVRSNYHVHRKRSGFSGAFYSVKLRQSVTRGQRIFGVDRKFGKGLLERKFGEREVEVRNVLCERELAVRRTQMWSTFIIQ